MPKIFARCLLCFIMIAPAADAVSQKNWELSKNKNGIKVYTRKTDSSKFKTVRVDAVLPGTLDKLSAILMGVEKNIKWVYATKTLRLIKRYNSTQLLYYAETALPGPMRNRDMPILITLYPDSINNKLKITTTGKPKDIPVNDGIVRVPYFLGEWDVTAIDSKTISIRYHLNVDPGGSIPAWLSNMFAAKGPYESFINLSKLLRE